MKICIIYSIILTGVTTLLWAECSGLKITAAEDFTWKLIENSLNCTKTTENFVIAPYEAYQLYKQIFNIPNDESNENHTQENNENPNEHYEYLSTVLPAAIRRQQKTTSHSNRSNQTDLISSISLSSRWSFNFQTRDTHKRIFNQFGKANQKIWVDFLRKDDTFHYAHSEQLNATILELPLNVKKIKLVLILPDQRTDLPDLKEYLLENMNEFSDLIKRTHKMTLVRVLLPKFHLTYKKDLTEFFEEMSSKKVENYDNIYQVSNLEFNERGIGRFERTTVLFWNAYSYLRVSPAVYDISHPFLFLITNKDGIQFFGQVVQIQN